MPETNNTLTLIIDLITNESQENIPFYFVNKETGQCDLSKPIYNNQMNLQEALLVELTDEEDTLLSTDDNNKNYKDTTILLNNKIKKEKSYLDEKVNAFTYIYVDKEYAKIDNSKQRIEKINYIKPCIILLYQTNTK